MQINYLGLVKGDQNQLQLLQFQRRFAGHCQVRADGRRCAHDGVREGTGKTAVQILRLTMLGRNAHLSSVIRWIGRLGRDR